jgi:iron complex outermembrane receptor protein
MASSLYAFAEQPLMVSDLADLSLEQLSAIEVTSVSRRPERLSDAPASIYVISAEDIRRSGVTTLPDALRLAPNLLVARADANQYAISARGMNNVAANKMLVMIDGRTVYTPLFSGVFWEAQDVMLEDVERIEVISGPGTPTPSTASST